MMKLIRRWRLMRMTVAAVNLHVPRIMRRMAMGDPYPLDDAPDWVVGIIILTHRELRRRDVRTMHHLACEEWAHRHHWPNPLPR
jgi:hypothetical protein